MMKQALCVALAATLCNALDYDVWISRVYHRESPCWEPGTEEYSVRFSLHHTSGGSHTARAGSNCLTCNRNGDCTHNAGNNRNAIARVQGSTTSTDGRIRLPMAAWEDDNGARCAHSTGFWINDDDCHWSGTCDLNHWLNTAPGSIGTYTCGNHAHQITINWQWTAERCTGGVAGKTSAMQDNCGSVAPGGTCTVSCRTGYHSRSATFSCATRNYATSSRVTGRLPNCIATSPPTNYPTTRPPTNYPTDYPTTQSPTDYPTTKSPTTAAPTAGCVAVIHEHYGHRGTSQTYTGPMTGPLHAATGRTNPQASTYQITGTPGCEVRLYCHAGYACWYHSNSQCNRHGNCADSNGNWEEVITVPASGYINGIIQHNDPRNAYINIRPAGGIGVSGDPFTTDANGNKVQFFLPLQQEQLLLTCDNVELYGRAMASGVAGDHQQWFDEFRVVKGSDELLKVKSTKDAIVGASSDDIDVAIVNQTAKKQTVELKPLTTISVDVMGQAMQKTGGVAYNGFELAVSQDALKRIGERYSETVDFTVGDQRMQFSSAAASKFESKTEQARLAHLDLKFVNLDTKKCSAGILAEIWGLKQMSAATTKMMQRSSTLLH